MMSEDELSCTICQCLFKDPRVLPCGHSFCFNCIKNWRKQSRECPVCRGDIGSINLPKNIALAGLVDRYKEQASSSSTELCSECFYNEKCCLCQHCRSSFCSSCSQKHMEKLRIQLTQQVKTLKTSIKEADADLNPIRSTLDILTQARTSLNLIQTDLVKAQTSLTTSLDQIEIKIDKLNSSITVRRNAINSARASLPVLEKTSRTDAAAIARSIGTANQLVELVAGGEADCEPTADVEAAKRLQQLFDDLCVDVAVLVNGKIIPMELSTGIEQEAQNLRQQRLLRYLEQRRQGLLKLLKEIPLLPLKLFW